MLAHLSGYGWWKPSYDVPFASQSCSISINGHFNFVLAARKPLIMRRYFSCVLIALIEVTLCVSIYNRLISIESIEDATP